MGPIHFLFGVETSKVGSVTDKWDPFIIFPFFIFSSSLSPYPPVPTAARTRPQPASTASRADDASSAARHPADEPGREPPGASSSAAAGPAPELARLLGAELAEAGHDGARGGARRDWACRR